MRLLDRFRIVLLDMNGTFMFDEDRFGPAEDFFSTYRSVGGTELPSADVTRFVRACVDGMTRAYADPERVEDFPSLAEGLRRYADPPEREVGPLERAITLHERGRIPPSCAVLLRRLARTHTLAVVSNIWGRKDAWLAEFERADIAKVFACTVFSSDGPCIKPSPVLYREALDRVGAAAEEALFVGDSLHYDMEGAKAVGMATAWITSRPRPHPSVDYVLSSIHEIEQRDARGV